MTSYRYRALNATGQLVRGTLVTARYQDVGSHLLRRGLHPLDIHEGPELERVLSLPKRADVLRALAEFLSHGISFERAVKHTEATFPGRETAWRLEQVCRLLHEGEAASSAMASVGLLSSLERAVIDAGEHAGDLAGAVSQVATHAAYERDVHAKLLKSLSYPMVLLATGMASALLIAIVVVPRFAVIAQSFGHAPPAFIASIIAFDSFIANHWVVVLAASLGIFVAIAMLSKRHSLRMPLTRASRALPGLRGVVRASESAAYSRALGALLRSGMPLMRAMQHMRNSAPTPEMRSAFSRTIERISAGEPLVVCLIQEGVLPASASPTLEVGELSGTLANALLETGKALQRASEQRIEALLSLLQPLLVLTLGSIIAAVAGSLLQSIYSIRPSL